MILSCDPLLRNCHFFDKNLNFSRFDANSAEDVATTTLASDLVSPLRRSSSSKHVNRRSNSFTHVTRRSILVSSLSQLPMWLNKHLIQIWSHQQIQQSTHIFTFPVICQWTICHKTSPEEDHISKILPETWGSMLMMTKWLPGCKQWSLSVTKLPNDCQKVGKL